MPKTRYFFIALFFLLLLCTLVSTPTEEVTPTPTIPFADNLIFQHVVVPTSVPHNEPLRTQAFRMLALCMLLSVNLLFIPRKTSDSNGRIVRHARYTSSVHQLFRADSAGG